MLDRVEEDALHASVRARFGAESLSAQVVAGRMIAELEEHDPLLLVAGPGIRAYLDRSYGGEVVDCACMINDIKATLTRLENESGRAREYDILVP
jgi:hypothetical protein